MTIQTDLEAARDQIEADAAKLHAIVHGVFNAADVVTDGGNVKPVAKAIFDALADFDAAVAASLGSLEDALTTADGSADAAAASAAAALVSANAAAATLASAMWRDIVHLTSADSPYAVTIADSGKLLVCDTTAAAIVINLATIASLGEPFNVSVKWEAGANSVTINRAGSDTIDGATSFVPDAVGSSVMLIGDASTTPDQWEKIVINGSPLTAGSGVTITDGSIAVDFSDQATAEAGASSAKVMSPLRGAQQFAALFAAANTFANIPARAKNATRLSLFNLAR